MSKSGMTWFRFYSDWRTNPKVKLLSDVLQLRFIDLMCLRCEGEIPGLGLDELSYCLRISKQDMEDTISALETNGLWSEGDICNWDRRQYKSDNSNSRVKRFRKRQCNVTVTGSESESDTDSDRRESESDPKSKTRAKPTKKKQEFAKTLLLRHGMDVPPSLDREECDRIIDDLKDKKVRAGSRAPAVFPADPDLTPKEYEESIKAMRKEMI